MQMFIGDGAKLVCAALAVKSTSQSVSQSVMPPLLSPFWSQVAQFLRGERFGERDMIGAPASLAFSAPCTRANP